MSIGVDYTLFRHLNPTKLKPFVKAKEFRTKEELSVIELKAWAQGVYNSHAIVSALSKKAKYPNKPLGLLNHQNSDGEELTEEEKQNEIDKLIASLQLFEANYKIEKLKKQIESQECAPS